MPGKNKPKRFNRNRSWRVTRRKKKRAEIVKGNSRSRNPRPKKKGTVKTIIEKVKKTISKEKE